MEKGKKGRFQTYPGPSRSELMLTHIIAQREPSLWDVPTDNQLRHAIQEDIMEIYSPERLKLHNGNRNLRVNYSIDLLTGWDLGQDETRKKLVGYTKALRPKVLVISPPCTVWCALMTSNWYRMKTEKRERQFREGQLHLEFAMLLVLLQISMGRKFVLEQPLCAKSWDHPYMKVIQSYADVASVSLDMCQFGLVSPALKMAMMKPTKVLTNLHTLTPKLVGKKCPRDHDHKMVQGMEYGIKLSKWAQIYPAPFCNAILDAVQELASD